MENEELGTILEKESDEFIKSSVEDLVPIPSESKDTSGSNSECDLPSCDDFSPINIPEGKSVTFSNPLFDSNDDFTSSNDNDINPLFDEVLEDIENKDPYQLALLVIPLFDANEDECFDPGGIIDEIDAFLDMEISTNIENGYHDSEGDIIYLESLLIDDTIPNLPPKVFLDHDPRSLKEEPDNKDLKILVKVEENYLGQNMFAALTAQQPMLQPSKERGNMEMEPDIENMTMSEYLEYEAVKVRRLWDDVRSRRSPTHYYEADFALLYRNKVILFISICLDSPPPTDSILS
ncbi:hypothetical protein Tco_0010854 [Tanacetum coccineum]